MLVDGSRTPKMQIHNRRVVTRGNPNERAGQRTVFGYAGSEAGVNTGSYGGEIPAGQVVGKINGSDAIERRFQCITVASELLLGLSQGRVSRDLAGTLCLGYESRWLSGDQGRAHLATLKFWAYCPLLKQVPLLPKLAPAPICR